MTTLRRIRNALLAAGVCAGLAAPAEAAKTLVFCSEGNPDHPSPALARTTTSFDMIIAVFDTLVRVDPATQAILPGLAESWTVSPDGLVYTFTLRAGAAFQTTADFTPTRPLNADDVLFSFLRQWRKDHPYHGVSGLTYDYFDDLSLPSLLKSIEALDERTVRFTLTRPEAPFLADLSMPFASIASAEYADRMMKAGTPERFDQAPLGTGPFQLVSYQKGTSVRFRAFAEHWNGRPPLDNLVFSITPNASVRLNKLQAGECHAMPFPQLADLPKIEADPNLVLLRQEGFNVGFLTFNVQKKPYDDVRVRRAVSMAIDRKTMVAAIYGSSGRIAKNPLPPASWGYDDSIEDTPYDPERAVRLLTEAGYPAGFDTDLWYMPVTRPYMPDAKRAAEMMRNDLAKIGIRATPVTDDWSVYMKRLMNGDHQAGMIGWTSDNGDPDNFLYTLLSCEAARPGGGNMAKWCHPDFESLIVRAKQTTDTGERTALYHQAQRIFKREAPWLPLAHSVVFMPLRKEVRGYRMSPFGVHDFRAVDLE